MRALWCFAVVIAHACSGSPKRDTPPPDRASEKAGCEPGRCLDDLSRAINGHREHARACYDEGRKRQPGLEGRIIINFEIDADGTVIDATQGMQDNQITEDGVVVCVSDVVRQVKFAKSPSGKNTRAYHRFEFSPL